jgi:hypothetical protein
MKLPNTLSFTILVESINKDLTDFRWKIQEACLKAVGFLANDLVIAMKGNDPSVNFDIMGLFNHVVLGHLSCSGNHIHICCNILRTGIKYAFHWLNSYVYIFPLVITRSSFSPRSSSRIW